MRTIISASIALAAVLSFTACSSEPPAQQPSPSPSVPSEPSPSASIDPTAPDGQCADADLELGVTDAGGAAGHVAHQIVFTNTGTSDCVLKDAPGVSVVDDGSTRTQLGEAAEQDISSGSEAVTLAPGASAYALLQSVNIGDGGGPLGEQCAVVTGGGYLVYPPHSFEAVFVPADGVPACGAEGVPWMTVGAVQANPAD